MKIDHFILFISCAVIASCQSSPTNSAGRVDALVGFKTAVNLDLFSTMDADVLWYHEMPPTARVSIKKNGIATIQQHPEVAYVQNIEQSNELVIVFIRFRDRPTGNDPLTARDRAAIDSAGGQIRYIYNIIPAVSVLLPASSIAELNDNEIVISIEQANGGIHASGGN